MAILPSYPCPPGNRNQVVGTVKGPASYTQITTGSPATGGVVVKATDIGLQAIEWFESSVSDDGQYLAESIFDLNPAKEVSQVRLIVTIAATGAQVAGAVDLSGRTFRFCAFGL